MTRLLLVPFQITNNNNDSLKRKRDQDNENKLAAEAEKEAEIQSIKRYKSTKEIDLAYDVPLWFKDELSNEESIFHTKSKRRLQAIIDRSLGDDNLSPPTIKVAVEEKTNACRIFDSFKYTNNNSEEKTAATNQLINSNNNNSVDEKSKENTNVATLKVQKTITSLLNKYFKFNLDIATANIMKCKRYNNDPTYEYHQLTKEQIELQFHLTLQRGILFHHWIRLKLLQQANNSNNSSNNNNNNNKKRDNRSNHNRHRFDCLAHCK